MPNYCYNSLSIEGPYDTLKKIHDLMREEENPFDFGKIIPMPDYIYKGDIGPEEKKIYGKNNWYDWCCKNWGTKWNSCDAHCDWVCDCLEYSFETAWRPCEPVIKALAALFPDTKILYSFFEDGCCFCGEQKYENGRMTYSVDEDLCEDYDEDYPIEDPDFWEGQEVLMMKEHEARLTALSHSYKDYDEMLKNDEGNNLYNEILNSAVEKVQIVSPESLTNYEVYALMDALAGFRSWPVDIDYWDLNSWEGEIDNMRRVDVSIEYTGRKLCELIDTSAPKEELNKWHEVYLGYKHYRLYPPEMKPDAVEKKLLDWGKSPNNNPADFAKSLSVDEVQTLLRSAWDFSNCDLPTSEEDSDLSRFEIVGQYIKSMLCCLVDEGDNPSDIMRWYNLNLAFNYAA